MSKPEVRKHNRGEIGRALELLVLAPPVARLIGQGLMQLHHRFFEKEDPRFLTEVSQVAAKMKEYKGKYQGEQHTQNRTELEKELATHLHREATQMAQIGGFDGSMIQRIDAILASNPQATTVLGQGNLARRLDTILRDPDVFDYDVNTHATEGLVSKRVASHMLAEFLHLDSEAMHAHGIQLRINDTVKVSTEAFGLDLGVSAQYEGVSQQIAALILNSKIDGDRRIKNTVATTLTAEQTAQLPLLVKKVAVSRFIENTQLHSPQAIENILGFAFLSNYLRKKKEVTPQA